MRSMWRGLGALALVALLAACSGAGADEGTAAPAGEQGATLRLGYFPNVTHAPAIAGVAQGLFAAALGADVTLEAAAFNAGPAAIEALFSGAVDATYIGPNPAVNGFAQSDGEALRIVAGATSGGAFLVVDDAIQTADDLAGATLSTPQLGNTQDVALRAWLAQQGYTTDLQGGGDVTIRPQENAQILETFRAGEIDGAWVPEPWATRLLDEGGGRVLVDERDLWPDGRYVTTHLVVRTDYLQANPEVVRNLLAGHVEAVSWVNENTAEAKAVVNAAIEELTGKALAPATIDGAWPNLEFTVDPIAASLQSSATDAVAVGLLEPVELDGIYSLDLLNDVLEAEGLEAVSGL